MIQLTTALWILVGVGLTTADTDKTFDATAILEKYGYLDDLPEGEHEEHARTNGVKDFQRFNGLPVTGKLDHVTIEKMKQPRCGLPDMVKPSLRPQRLGEDQQQPQAFYASGYKWDTNDITYKFVGYTTKLGGQDQRDSVTNAFRKWADVTPLNFRETADKADIELSFQRYDHGDGVGNRFDGKGGTLAHAFYPGKQDLSGDTHFDEDEEWTVREDRGTNLEIVAAHEFGHALGLSHSSVPQALMAPYYQGYDSNFQLHSDDKRGIQTIYGSGRGQVQPREVTMPTTTSTRRPSTAKVTRNLTTHRPTPKTAAGAHCSVPFDSIILAHDASTYAFSGTKVYKLEPYTGVARDFPKPTRQLYNNAPSNIDAAVFDRSRGKTYFFKGSRFWRYTGFQLDLGYPKQIPQLFRNIAAALQWKDGRIYLFKKGGLYFPWSEGQTAMTSGYPRPLTQFWIGVGPEVGAALQWSDGRTYFFNGERYWKFDDVSLRVVSGYPKSKAAAWLGCGTPSLP